MAFTVEGEYKRLLGKEYELYPNKIPFESGVVCGYVTELKYIPRHYNEEVHRYIDEVCEVWVQTGFKKTPELAFTITKDDVCRRYQDRKYRWNKTFSLLEYFPYKYDEGGY